MTSWLECVASAYIPKLIGAAADTMMSAHGSISDNIIIGYNAYYCIIIDRMGPLMVGGCWEEPDMIRFTKKIMSRVETILCGHIVCFRRCVVCDRKWRTRCPLRMSCIKMLMMMQVMSPGNRQNFGLVFDDAVSLLRGHPHSWAETWRRWVWGTDDEPKNILEPNLKFPNDVF